MYMITLEVEGRRPLFGRIVGNPFAERGSNEEPRIELTELGKAVQSEWMGIHGFYPQIEIKAVQMMPDHMHGILFVTAPLPVHLGQVISGFKAGCRKAQRMINAIAAAKPQPTEKDGTEEEAQSSLQVTAVPSQESLLPSQESKPYEPLFAKGYNDLVLRSYDELPTWQNYLRDNPRRLMMKRARPDWLRPFFNLRKGDQQYNGIGNRELLKQQGREQSSCHQPSRQARKGLCAKLSTQDCPQSCYWKTALPHCRSLMGSSLMPAHKASC